MTFSISGRCEKTGTFGIAIASSSPAVAARCAHARAGVGVVATQNVTDPSLGPKGLDLMAAGLDAEAALAKLLDGYATAEYRQLVLVDAKGNAAIHSGAHTLGTFATAKGRHCAAAGNMLAGTGVPSRMVEAFEAAQGPLGDRLIAAMQAGQAAGGEAGPVHSAGLLMVRDVSWPIADLRVDWAEADPVGRLAALWTLYEPQLEDYIARALEPDAAPRYGVPGDE
ncbi:DUF1028 domain-containing protein [Rhizobiaceae bacterium BDR2-2]|uniref:DUF1028 domain-containing protein n=1 Tax=Ectorhizobium quercum TaxID=2965071 RepID=A0AAE3SWE1_9HYPH|nr:DUF1028 domain-containing protein [Ectorhizobium quercum]MCX8997929.1 DUF1028 domain-containing protein [Ectorhizobium quercum]